MLTVPLTLALLLQAPFPTGLVLPPARPTTYRLADLSGTTWTHTDPVWLRTYVGQVNARRAQPRYFVPAAGPYYYGSPCAGGQCPR
jgi:hypothetical protein